MRFFRKKGRIRRLGLTVLAGLLLACLVAPAIFRYVVRSRLQSMISAQLDADLTIGGLKYTFPYAVDVTDASITTHDGPDSKPLELLHLSHLALKLAQSPLRSGPLVIESVLIENPSIHLVKGAHGLIGRRSSQPQPEAPAKPRPKDWKLSQMLQLHRLSLHGGVAIYEDRSLPHTLPLIWEDLNFDVDTAPLSSSEYAFHLTADDAPQASFEAIGLADIDTLLIRLTKCGLTLAADSAVERSALPPEYQQLIQRMNVRGALSINTTANVYLTDLRRSTYDTTLELRQASASPPQFSQPIRNLTAQLRLHDQGGKPSLSFAYINAQSGGLNLKMEGGSVVLDPATLEWKLSGLTGHLDAASLPGDRLAGNLDFELSGSAPLLGKNIRQFNGQLKVTPKQLRTIPHLFPDPIDQFAEATFTLVDGKISARQLRAGYGDDVWFIKSADVDLKSLPRELLLTNFEGCLTFSPNRNKYPAPVEKILAQINPVGPWFIDADNVRVPLAAPEKTDYHASIHTPRARLTLNDGRIAVYNINAAINAVPGIVRVEHFDAATLQGEVHVTGWAQPKKAGQYDFNAKVDRIEMRDLVQAFQKPGAKPTPLSGRAVVVAHGQGQVPPDNQPFLDGLQGDGTFSVENGNFWQIPLFKDLAKSVNVKEALTVGDAFGTFTVDHQTVHLNPVAVSAPVLGVQGTGDVTFKSNVNLDLVVIPGQVGKANGRNAIGNVLAEAQQVFAFASKVVLYRVHVEGPASSAKIDPKLVAAEEVGGLLDRIQGKKSQ